MLLLTARAPLKDEYGLLTLIASRLGYVHEWENCFTALADIATADRAPLILLDAINESSAEPLLMREALRLLLEKAERAGVKVVVTCRTDFWQFYRAPFWRNYIDQTEPSRAGLAAATAAVRGYDLPLFPPEQFDNVLPAYFAAFNIQGELRAEARERCRHPLVLRLFCEAYQGNIVDTVTELRLYRLFKLFWERKIGQVADVANLRQTDAVARLVLTVAALMRGRATTSVPRADVARALDCEQAELDSSTSLYSRVLDEEIVLEENVDEEAGIRNVVFVYDRFAEYSLALSIYTAQGWQVKPAAAIVSDAAALMDEEYQFGSLRGALEFLVQRLEDRRPEDLVHFKIIQAMVDRDWKWRRIGTVLTFQLDPEILGASFWQFADSLAGDAREFVRRIVADQVILHATHHPDEVLSVLSRLLDDPSRSVRETARSARLRLPATVVIREIRRLASAHSGLDNSQAAELLLWPLDSTSAILRHKLEWFLAEAPEIIPFGLLTAHLDTAELGYLDGLFGLEEVASAVKQTRSQMKDQAKLRNSSALAERLDGLVALRRDTLTSGLIALSRLLQLAFLTAKMSAGRDLSSAESAEYWQSPYLGNADDLRNLAKRLISRAGLEATKELDQWLHENLDRSRLISFVALLAHLLLASDPYADREMLDQMMLDIAAGRMTEFVSLSAIAMRTWERVSPGSGRTAIDLTVALDTRFRGLSPDEYRRKYLQLQDEILADYRLLPSPTERRGLTTVGRIALWIWSRVRLQEERQSRTERVRAEISAMTAQQLRDRLLAYQQDSPTEQLLLDLNDDLLAIARELAQDPAALAAVMAPIIIWDDDREGEMIDDQVAELHRRDAGTFWLLAQALLAHADQRIVDLASRAIERAEHAEREEPVDVTIMAELAEILDEVAGVSTDQVRAESTFVDDLDIDSLSMVEIAVAAQDKFGVEVPDDDLKTFLTVGDVVNYIKKALAEQGRRLRR